MLGIPNIRQKEVNFQTSLSPNTIQKTYFSTQMFCVKRNMCSRKMCLVEV